MKSPKRRSLPPCPIAQRRQTRQQWLARLFGLVKRVTGLRHPREKKAPAKPSRWLILGAVYTAHTKSEARALHKAATGNPIPPGTVIARLVKTRRQRATRSRPAL